MPKMNIKYGIFILINNNPSIAWARTTGIVTFDPYTLDSTTFNTPRRPFEKERIDHEL